MSIGSFLTISCSKLAKLSSKGSEYCDAPVVSGDKTLGFGLSGDGTTPTLAPPPTLTGGCAGMGDGIVGGLSLADCFLAAGAATGAVTATGLVRGDGPLVTAAVDTG